MKKNLTELVFILDRSGSMSGLEEDTIGGFNSMMQKQKKEPGDALVTTVLFNGRKVMIHDRVHMQDVPPMTEKEYFVGGSTALLDAVGWTVSHIEEIHHYVRTEDVPERTLFVIITDGMENSSRHYSMKQIKTMIEKRQKMDGWEFLFLGANIDAEDTAERIGIHKDHAVDYLCDEEGIDCSLGAVDQAISNYRRDRKLDAGWKQEVERDYMRRKKR